MMKNETQAEYDARRLAEMKVFLFDKERLIRRLIGDANVQNRNAVAHCIDAKKFPGPVGFDEWVQSDFHVCLPGGPVGCRRGARAVVRFLLGGAT